MPVGRSVRLFVGLLFFCLLRYAFAVCLVFYVFCLFSYFFACLCVSVFYIVEKLLLALACLFAHVCHFFFGPFSLLICVSAIDVFHFCCSNVWCFRRLQVKGKAAIDGLGSRLGKSGASFLQQGLVLAFGNMLNAAPVVAGGKPIRMYRQHPHVNRRDDDNSAHFDETVRIFVSLGCAIHFVFPTPQLTLLILYFEVYRYQYITSIHTSPPKRGCHVMAGCCRDLFNQTLLLGIFMLILGICAPTRLVLLMIMSVESTSHCTSDYYVACSHSNVYTHPPREPDHVCASMYLLTCFCLRECDSSRGQSTGAIRNEIEVIGIFIS